MTRLSSTFERAASEHGLGFIRLMTAVTLARPA